MTAIRVSLHCDLDIECMDVLLSSVRGEVWTSILRKFERAGLGLTWIEL